MTILNSEKLLFHSAAEVGEEEVASLLGSKIVLRATSLRPHGTFVMKKAPPSHLIAKRGRPVSDPVGSLHCTGGYYSKRAEPFQEFMVLRAPAFQ